MACHCPDEGWPFAFREALHATEACPLADVAYVPLGVVPGWRCPARDDVGDAVQPVLVAVGAEQAESGADAPGDALEPDELRVRLSRALSLPMGTCNPQYVQRVAVPDTSRFHRQSASPLVELFVNTLVVTSLL